MARKNADLESLRKADASTQVISWVCSSDVKAPSGLASNIKVINSTEVQQLKNSFTSYRDISAVTHAALLWRVVCTPKLPGGEGYDKLIQEISGETEVPILIFAKQNEVASIRNKLTSSFSKYPAVVTSDSAVLERFCSFDTIFWIGSLNSSIRSSMILPIRNQGVAVASKTDVDDTWGEFLTAALEETAGRTNSGGSKICKIIVDIQHTDPEDLDELYEVLDEIYNDWHWKTPILFYGVSSSPTKLVKTGEFTKDVSKVTLFATGVAPGSVKSPPVETKKAPQKKSEPVKKAPEPKKIVETKKVVETKPKPQEKPSVTEKQTQPKTKSSSSGELKSASLVLTVYNLKTAQKFRGFAINVTTIIDGVEGKPTRIDVNGSSSQTDKASLKNTVFPIVYKDDSDVKVKIVQFTRFWSGGVFGVATVNTKDRNLQKITMTVPEGVKQHKFSGGVISLAVN